MNRLKAMNGASTLMLAEYANGKLAPLVEQLNGGSMNMTIYLGQKYFEDIGAHWSVSISVMEHSSASSQGSYVISRSCLTSSDEVDTAVAEVKKHLDKLKDAA